MASLAEFQECAIEQGICSFTWIMFATHLTLITSLLAQENAL